MGLYDAFLIKENHIRACGSITNAIKAAQKIAPDKKVEVIEPKPRNVNVTVTDEPTIEKERAEKLASYPVDSGDTTPVIVVPLN